jgi:hypothetical protein
MTIVKIVKNKCLGLAKDEAGKRYGTSGINVLSSPAGIVA